MDRKLIYRAGGYKDDLEVNLLYPTVHYAGVNLWPTIFCPEPGALGQWAYPGPVCSLATISVTYIIVSRELGL
jgi:hypothetical protein